MLFEKCMNLVVTNCGPTLMAGWTKALPLTASCLLPLPGFESQPGHVRKLPGTARFSKGNVVSSTSYNQPGTT